MVRLNKQYIRKRAAMDPALLLPTAGAIAGAIAGSYLAYKYGRSSRKKYLGLLGAGTLVGTGLGIGGMYATL